MRALSARQRVWEAPASWCCMCQTLVFGGNGGQLGSVETGLSPLSRSPCPTAGRWEHWAGLVLRCRQCWGSPLGLVCLVPREMLLMWTPSEGVWGRSGLPGPPPPVCPRGSLRTWICLTVGTRGCGGGAELWQLWAGLPGKCLALLGLFLNSPRREPDPAQKRGSCTHCWGDAVALLSAGSELPSSAAQTLSMVLLWA